MRVIITAYFLFNSFLAFAQTKRLPPPPPPSAPEECLYGKIYTDSALLCFYPFSRSANIQLVSFQYHSNSLPIKKNRILTDSLIETKTLSKKEVLELADLFYNNYAKNNAPPQASLCGFVPRNAILFFDNSGKLKSSVLICFHCMEYQKSEERINLGNECSGKLEKLRSFFIAKGVKFGADVSTEDELCKKPNKF